ncbi:MAG TPA: hypothetical protein VK988_07265 [Acidimicrobiales bacterium]|nr:hypothetical protein [Acidimicrobiales bacterium]
MDWSVNVEAASQAGDDRVDQDAMEVLLELLDDHHVGGVAVSPGRYGARFNVESPTSVEAAAEAEEVFRKAAAAAGLPAWPVVRLEVMTVEELDADLAQATFPRLVGVAELAEILEVSRARASELARSSSDFPPPTVRLASGPVWTEPSVRRFIEAWRRRPGPAPRSSRSAKPGAVASVK